MNFVQLLRKANDLKAQLTAEGGNDAWVTRQALQDAFHQLLLGDLESALDKKLEQELWNHVFKNHISSLQHKARDRMNPKRTEVQAMLSVVLDNASGFYIQLLQEICSAFNIQLACRIKAQRLGLFSEVLPSPQKLVQPKATSCLYICQHCLVHLGDIARYRNDTQQAESFYCHAASLVPSNGQPYNQLAIVSATKGDQLSMAFYYIRSIAVKHPFPAAATNLQTTYAKLVDRDEVKIFKMKEVELIHYFIKFHAIIYLASCEQDLQVASSIKDKLEENFRSHLSQEILTSRQLTQMAAINLFALQSIRQHTDNGERITKTPSELSGLSGTVDGGPYSANNGQCWTLVMGFTFNLLQMMLHYTPQKSGEASIDTWPGLPAVRLLLGWIYLQSGIFDDPVLSSKTSVWSKLGRVLTSLQVDSSPQADDLESSLPLPEDNLLDGFTPLQEFQRDLDFGQSKHQGWTRAAMNQERCQRLASQGKWLAHHQPSLLKVETSPSDKLLFTSPLGDDVTSRRSSHHQQRQQKATKTSSTATTTSKAVETGTKSPAAEKETSKKVGRDGVLKRESGRDRGDEEGPNKTIAVQAIMSRSGSDVSKPTVTFKVQDRQSHAGQSSGVKSSKQSPSSSHPSSHTKDQDTPKRVQWQNPPHAYAQEPSFYPQQKVPPTSQPHHQQSSPQPVPQKAVTNQPPQGHIPHGHAHPRHPPPPGPYPQQGNPQRMPHPYGHPPPPPPGVPPPSLGLPPDQMFPPPMGPPPSFPGAQGAPPRSMQPPPPRQLGPPPPPHGHSGQGGPPAWQHMHRDSQQNVQRDGPSSTHLGREGVPPPHMQPPKVQIPPPMPQGPKLSSPTANIPHPQHQQQQVQSHQRPPQGTWTRPPLDRAEDHSTDTMANISMWNSALPENLPSTSTSHMPRGGVDAAQYQQHQQVQGKGMGRDTSPMRSPIGNSPQFRLSPSMEDYNMQQGGGMGLQTSQPQAMPRRLSNPSEQVQMPSYSSYEHGQRNFMPSMPKPHEQFNPSIRPQHQQQQMAGAPPPHILDSQGSANLLELLAKMQKQIPSDTGSNPSGSGKSGFSPEHSGDAYRSKLESGLQQEGFRDPPGFQKLPDRFPHQDPMGKDGSGSLGVSDYYRMSQEVSSGAGYDPLHSRPQGESAFRKVHPQQREDSESIFLRSDMKTMDTKESASFKSQDAFSFFSAPGSQQEKPMLAGDHLKYGRNIFGQESSLQEPQNNYPRRMSGSMYETSTSFPTGKPTAPAKDQPWGTNGRERGRSGSSLEDNLLDYFPSHKMSGGVGSNSGSNDKRAAGYERGWPISREQVSREGTRRASHEALFSQMTPGGGSQTMFPTEPFIDQDSSASFSSQHSHQSTPSKNSYFSGASNKGKQSDEENVFSSSGNSYSLFSSPSPWSARQDEDGGGMSKAGEGLGGSLGLKWREPQLSSSPTSSLLPERIQSIWSSPLRSEQSPLEKILGHKVSLEQQKPDT